MSDDAFGTITWESWSEAKTNCEAAFDTKAGDYKCVEATYVNLLGIGGGTCIAWLASASAEAPAEYASEDAGSLGEYNIGAGLGGMQLAAGSAAALAATYFMWANPSYQRVTMKRIMVEMSCISIVNSSS